MYVYEIMDIKSTSCFFRLFRYISQCQKFCVSLIGFMVDGWIGVYIEYFDAHICMYRMHLDIATVNNFGENKLSICIYV